MTVCIHETILIVGSWCNNDVISCGWNRMLSFDLCPYDVILTSCIILMHRFMTYCLFVTQLISQLPPSFTVSVCASYRGRGLGSTLCKSLVTHVASCYKLVGCHCVYMYEQRMNHVSLKKRQSHQLRRACFNQCGQWPTTVYHMQGSWWGRLASSIWLVSKALKDCCYEQSYVFVMSQVSAKMVNHKRSTDKQPAWVRNLVPLSKCS